MLSSAEGEENGEGLNKVLLCPQSRRMLSDIKVNYTPSVMRQHNKDK
jgi:hypothetical protein